MTREMHEIRRSILTKLLRRSPRMLWSEFSESFVEVPSGAAGDRAQGRKEAEQEESNNNQYPEFPASAPVAGAGSSPL